MPLRGRWWLPLRTLARGDSPSAGWRETRAKAHWSERFDHSGLYPHWQVSGSVNIFHAPAGNLTLHFYPKKNGQSILCISKYSNDGGKTTMNHGISWVQMEGPSLFFCCCFFWLAPSAIFPHHVGFDQCWRLVVSTNPTIYSYELIWA